MLEKEVLMQTITFNCLPLHLSVGEKKGCDGATMPGEHIEYVYRLLLSLDQKEIDRITKKK